MGVWQPGYLVESEFQVTVTEEKEVPAMWGQDTYTGIKAVTADGKEFTRNWNYFPDDSMTPCYYWDALEDELGVWQPEDAVQAYNMGFVHVDNYGNRKIPAGFEICRKHDKVVEDGVGCWNCFMENRYNTLKPD